MLLMSWKEISIFMAKCGEIAAQPAAHTTTTTTCAFSVSGFAALRHRVWRRARAHRRWLAPKRANLHDLFERSGTVAAHVLSNPTSSPCIHQFWGVQLLVLGSCYDNHHDISGWCWLGYYVYLWLNVGGLISSLYLVCETIFDTD